MQNRFYDFERSFDLFNLLDNCVVSITVIQLCANDLVPCAWNWCQNNSECLICSVETSVDDGRLHVPRIIAN